MYLYRQQECIKQTVCDFLVFPDASFTILDISIAPHTETETNEHTGALAIPQTTRSLYTDWMFTEGELANTHVHSAGEALCFSVNSIIWFSNTRLIARDCWSIHMKLEIILCDFFVYFVLYFYTLTYATYVAVIWLRERGGGGDKAF